MLELPLFDRLLEKIPTGAHLLLVGDVDQFPSIGPGKVLADLLNVLAVPQVRLTRVFRQDPPAVARALHDGGGVRGLHPYLTEQDDLWWDEENSHEPNGQPLRPAPIGLP